ncbi:MAG: 16S rRNA (guanine(527)-N(7))-methyltransferase RsmG [Desulfobacterales bacterium]|jgi:16S rRNA (guanine527-N7)-methyltransferase
MEIGSQKWKGIIREGAKAFGVPVTAEQTHIFAIHARELIRWNRKINLTAIVDPLEIAVKHFVDSIAPASTLPRHDAMLDIGSGGGFPGIPLKVLIPTLSATLVDASRKKVSFLNHVCRIIELQDVDVRQIRGENIIVAPPSQETLSELPKPPHNRKVGDFSRPFGIIISRALTSLKDFILMALPMLSKNGLMVAMRGKTTEADLAFCRSMVSRHPIASASGVDGLSVELRRYQLPFYAAERSLLMIRKNG